MKKRILIVDDEPNVRLNYRVTLDTEGYAIAEASSGKMALQLLAGDHVDLTILDLKMPEMDGLDLLEEMRKRGLETPAVIITAFGDIPQAVRAMRLGAIDFLQKPVTPKQLRQIADEVLARHEPAVEVLPEVHAEPSLSAEEVHALYLQNAKRLLNLRQFEQARVHLAKAMTLDPLSPVAFNLAGLLFEMLEDYDRAKKHYAQAIKLDPHYEPARQNLRRIHDISHRGSSKEPAAFGEI